MEGQFKTIDPTQGKLPETAIIEKVTSEKDRLPNEEHDNAVRAFFVSDGIASGIGKDLAFVDKIPQFINEIIENKSWECLYVAKGVVTPFYCRYTKGTDSENFRSYITAKRPNGLETSVGTLDRVLQADLEVQRKFRAVIYESHQGERTDLDALTSDSDYPKLGNALKSAQQKRIRAANRAAEAIPEIGDLLDRGLISIDVAARLGCDIRDPENLTAEEREYVDKRDLIGIRLRQYINTNPIPEDEDKEPAYSRELNHFVKDLLGIKDRSKSVRMDHPKKAAEKLLKFYQGEKLKELVEHLRQGLEPLTEQPEKSVDEHEAEISAETNDMHPEDTSQDSDFSAEVTNIPEVQTEGLQKLNSYNNPLNVEKLAERLGLKPQTVLNVMYNQPKQFPKWSKQRDPDHIAWQRTGDKKGKLTLFSPVSDNNQEENSDAIKNGV